MRRFSIICSGPILAFAYLTAPAFAEVSEDDLQLLDCTVRALTVSGLVEDLVEAGAELPDGLAEAAETFALDLLLTAEPLFSNVEGANAAMDAAIDRVGAERAAAFEADVSGAWFRSNFAAARDCHAQFVPQTGAGQ